MPLSYVNQAILFPRLICFASFFLLFNSTAQALETVFITGYITTSGSDTNSVVLKSIDNGRQLGPSGQRPKSQRNHLCHRSKLCKLFRSRRIRWTIPRGIHLQHIRRGTNGSIRPAQIRRFRLRNLLHRRCHRRRLQRNHPQIHQRHRLDHTSQLGPKLNGISIDANVVYAVGASGTVQKTTDGGANWSSQTTDSNYVLYGVNAVDATTAYAVGKMVQTA